MDPNQTVPIGAFLSGSTQFFLKRYLKHFSKGQKQTILLLLAL